MIRRKPLRARGKKKPTKALAERLRRISQETACVVGTAIGMELPSTVHHLTVGGKHGAPRRGDRYTVALNQWSHLGLPLREDWDEDEHRRQLGPSYAKEPKAFRDLYSDDWLLEATDHAIGWKA